MEEQRRNGSEWEEEGEPVEAVGVKRSERGELPSEGGKKERVTIGQRNPAEIAEDRDERLLGAQEGVQRIKRARERERERLYLLTPSPGPSLCPRRDETMRGSMRRKRNGAARYFP